MDYIDKIAQELKEFEANRQKSDYQKTWSNDPDSDDDYNMITRGK
jgi:hypothetical protein